MLSSTHLLRHPQALAAASLSVVAIGALTAAFVFRRRPTPEERETRRRARLATIGRVIDGTLLESTHPDGDPDTAPHALIYRYRIAGVTYECGQDVSTLAPHIPPLGPESILFGTPIQVRYDRNNPADSIIVAETWNGLWPQHHTH